jgi:ribonucleoside-diphosphate reductase alpha chain
MEHPDILLNEENQQICARIAVNTNKKWAKILGINQAARVTCCKPSGTASTVLEVSCSGIHPAHAKRYFRRIQMNKNENVYQWFKSHVPEACEESVWSANKTDDVVTFPIEVGDNAILKDSVTAIQHLDVIKATQKNWVEHGTSEANRKNIHHSISCTVIVKPNEWGGVIDYLYENRHDFTAVSLLASDGDKTYQQAPFEAVLSEEDNVKFDNLVSIFKEVDYTKMFEEEDETELQKEMSCVGGVCLI